MQFDITLLQFHILRNGSMQQLQQIVFWDKGYYHTLVSGLRSHGYQLQQVKPATNVLRFQREGSSVIADITVWADIYVLELHS